MMRSKRSRCLVISIALTTFLASNIAFSQESEIFSPAEWRSVVGDSRTQDELLDVMMKITREGSEATSAGRSGEGRHKLIMSLVLSRYILEYSRSKGEYVSQDLVYSSDKLENSLLSTGVTPAQINDAQRNLYIIMPKIAPLPSMRPVNAGESAPIVAAIRKKMIDPNSLIIDKVYMYAPLNGIRGACAVFNAKNRMGGYAGRQSIIVYYENSQWNAGSASAIVNCEDMKALYRNHALRD
ncbi:hypothetical protein [Novosphingobium album (ex Hu et al. 2023)]|uniref:DUF2927 domain-containing protein n=1 Tax=Novosphingobium album (ex Hu et al. 2023) TaxID=2930093 RepID=A0ABT0B0M0_9SPHN|nr:hypothetical protein [Novosphingobium album (ex Hu et al. 2023)]MCJ2178592.1 hypothetical protein [Novosphingobium album (ex Hu et al. 2023)]